MSELFFFWPCIDSANLTVHFIMHSLFLYVLLLSESNVCPSHEINSKHEVVNLKITQKCNLKYATTPGFLIMYFEICIIKYLSKVQIHLFIKHRQNFQFKHISVKYILENILNYHYFKVC